MKKNIGFISLIIMLFLLCVSGVYCYQQLHQKNKEIEIDHYIIHFYNSYYVYDIETTQENIQVRKSELVECFKDPCYPLEVDSFVVGYTEDYIDFFKNTFDNRDEKELVLMKNDLSQEQLVILFSMIKEKYVKEKLDYTLLHTKKDSDKYAKKGYYVENMSNGEVLVTISMGEQSTGGYNIIIENVYINEGDVEIVVEELKPAAEDDVTDAFTTPIAQVKFNENPDSLSVLNITDGQYYKLIEKIIY